MVATTSVEGLDLDAHAHVVGAAGGLLAQETRVVTLAGLADAAEGNPLAEATTDSRVCALHIDHTWLVAVYPVVVAADADVHHIAGQAGGDVEALGDIAVLGVLVDLAVGTDAGVGQW